MESNNTKKAVLYTLTASLILALIGNLIDSIALGFLLAIILGGAVWLYFSYEDVDVSLTERIDKLGMGVGAVGIGMCLAGMLLELTG